MDNTNLLTRQQLLFGISPDEQQRQVERERAKDDARRRTLLRFRDYAEKNNLELLSDRVSTLLRKPRAQPAAPVTDDVSAAALSTGGVDPNSVAAPTTPVVPAAPVQAPVEPPAPAPAVPEAPAAPEVPETPPTPSAPETPALSAPESPSEPEAPAAPTEPEAPTAASLVDNSDAADDGSSDDTSTNEPSDNEV